MADKIEKLLAKLPAKDLRLVGDLLARIVANELRGLDVTRLKGSRDIYRARKGNYRIIYSLDKHGNIKILAVARRDERTYKDF